MELPNIFSLEQIDQFVNEDFEKIVVMLSRLKATDRISAVSKLSAIFSDEELVESERIRIVLARILVGLLPESGELLTSLISAKTKPLDYEIHFTLFCYLTYVSKLTQLQSSVPMVLSLARDYLLEAKTDVGCAAWMAGHMMGHEWEGEEAKLVLIEALQTAKFREGRLSALDAISYWLERTDNKAPLLSEVKKALKSEKDKNIRHSIKSLLIRHVAPLTVTLIS